MWTLDESRQFDVIFLSVRANETPNDENSLAIFGLIQLGRFSRRNPGERHAWSRRGCDVQGPGQSCFH